MGEFIEDTIIKIEQASVTFKNFVIKPVSMELPKGYIIGIEGPNGAGKSTLIKMLLGRYEKMEGSIQICGLDVLKEREKMLTRIGYVSEENVFFEEYDACDNERLYKDFYECWDSELFKEYLKKFKVSGSTKVGALSKGNKIRFQVAFALAHAPEVLIMDEPTAGLDPVFRTEFYRMLQEIVAENNTTILISTHIQEEMERLADYIICVDSGSVTRKEV